MYSVRKILKNSFVKYRKDDPIRLAGTTAYFTIFAIAPILIIIISVLGVIFEEKTISNKIYDELNVLVGSQGTDFIKSIIQLCHF